MFRIAFLTAALFAASPGAQATAIVGQVAPQFTGVDSNGKTHKLSDYAGKTVVLEWSNHDCPYVKKHYGGNNMQVTQLAATLTGAVWLTIVSSAPGKQGNVTGAEANDLTKRRTAFPAAVILDPTGTIGRLYDARTTPHMFVIDGAQKLRYAGAIDDKPTAAPESLNGAKNYALAAINDVFDKRKVAVPETEPYGCSVKY
jgi:hypothetical protein